MQPHHDLKWDDQTAEWYTNEYGDHFSTKLAVELAFFDKTDAVLDIGCGSGTSCRAIAEKVTQGQVIGIDPTSGMIKMAKEKNADDPNSSIIKYMDGRAESIPLGDGSVTVALAVNSFYHWNDMEKGLAEVLRILNNNGRFYIADEKLENGQTHGNGPNSDQAHIKLLLLDSGFVDVSLSNHRHVDEEMYFFSMIKK